MLSVPHYAPIAPQMEPIPLDVKIQAVSVGNIFPKIPPLIAICAGKPVVGAKTFRPAAVSEELAATGLPGEVLAPLAIQSHILNGRRYDMIQYILWLFRIKLHPPAASIASIPFVLSSNTSH